MSEYTSSGTERIGDVLYEIDETLGGISETLKEIANSLQGINERLERSVVL